MPHLQAADAHAPLAPETLAALDARLGAGRVRRRVPLAKYTSFRIGGPADALYTARTADELAAAVLAARELGIPHFLLGLGANILVGDRGLPRARDPQPGRPLPLPPRRRRPAASSPRAAR
jgi:hypothetical protein